MGLLFGETVIQLHGEGQVSPEVQDPEARFGILYFRQIGIPIARQAVKQVASRYISLVAAWHFQRYIALYDPSGFLKRAKHIAGTYPTQAAVFKSVDAFAIVRGDARSTVVTKASISP